MEPLVSQTLIDDLCRRVDIVSVVGDVVHMHGTGATRKGLCPFHVEKTPSFHVDVDKGFFHCFGCGVGGDVIKFVELYEKVSFFEAVRMLAGRFRVRIPEARNHPSEDESDALLRFQLMSLEGKLLS